MSAPFTLTKLATVKDSAAEFGVGEIQEARFANRDLEAEDTGVSHHRIHPGKRQPFAHKHEEAEEIYVILSGSGRVKLGEEIVEVEELDAIRVAPGVVRQLEAGPEGIEFLAFGPQHQGDAEMVKDWWTDEDGSGLNLVP